MQIASAFKTQGRAVAILDADINGPSQVRLGGIQNAALLPGKSGLAIPKTREGIAVLSFASLFKEGQAVKFESVASGDTHTWRATREFSVLADILACAEWGELDVLLVDLPPGAERTLQFADGQVNRAFT